MGVTAANLIAGPGTLYIADFGTTEPADSTISSTLSASGWADVGGTQDGVTLNITQEYFDLEVDQIVDVPSRRQVKRDLRIVTNLAEPTLANLKIALNGGTVTASASYATYDPDDVGASQAPTFRAAIFEGIAPGGLRRRVIVRKVLSVEGVEAAYKKGEQTLFPVTLAANYVTSAIKPFRVVDQTV